MTKFQQELVSLLGFQFDEASKALYGKQGSYLMALSADSQSNQWSVTLSLTDGSAPDAKRMKELAKEVEGIQGSTVTGYRVSFTIKPKLFGGMADAMRDSLLRLSETLTRDGYRNCSESDGTEDDVLLYQIDGRVVFLTEEQFQAIVSAMQEKREAYANKPNNLLGGLIGGLLGAILGAGVILLISQLGYIAIFSGIVMGVLTVKGFELFGGKLNLVSILLLCAIMLGMVYVANRADYAIALAKAAVWSVTDAFRYVEEVIHESNLTAQYWTEFGKQLLFTALGAVPMMIGALQSRKKQFNAYALNIE